MAPRLAFQQGLERLVAEREERENRVAARTERHARHRQMFRFYGSDYEPSSDGDLMSQTASEIQMEDVQYEADLYMNSPGPGSD